MSTLSRIREFIRCVVRISVDVLTLFCLSLRSSAALAAENLFLRKQLALYVERRKKRRRPTDSVRFTLAQLARFFKWRDVLTVVKPDTLVCWHHKGFRLFWKWKSRSRGRPRVPVELQKLIAEMATNNTTWGEERIANELLLKLGIQTAHYNRSRPHSSLGPGIPDPNVQKQEIQINRHCIPKDHRIVVIPLLGGLHHDYQMQRIAA